nr:pIIIa [Siadenovirus sp.]
MASKQLVTDILSGGAPTISKEFRHLPLADKIIELEKAVVEPKKSDTPALLNVVVKQLVNQGAIYPEEASAVYSRLLERLVKFNSLRSYNNLQQIAQDVQQGQRSVVVSNLMNTSAMSNMVVLQNFFNSLPKTVAYGQQNYDAFKQLLKQFVIDYNKFLELYKSGPETFLQYNFGPAVQKINLTQAFNNLSDMWGAKITKESSIPSLIALLHPQTRFLLLLMSPIAMEGYFMRDTFISYILKLYKNTVSPPLGAEPIGELGNLIATLGPGYDQLKLRQGLNYMLTNQQQQYRPEVPEFTKEEEALLRYIQTLLKTKIAGRRRMLDEHDLDNVIRNLNLSAFPGQLDFINKLFDYFRKVIQTKPQLLTKIIYDNEWRPPPAFFLKNVLLPQDLDIISAPAVPHEEVVLPPPMLPEVTRVPLNPSVPRRLPPPSIRRRKRTPAPTEYREPVRYTTDTETEDSSFSGVPLLPKTTPGPSYVMPELVRPEGTYRKPVVYTTDISSSSESVPVPSDSSYSNHSGRAIDLDFDGLSASFKNLSGRGIQGMQGIVMQNLLSKARRVNIRPY